MPKYVEGPWDKQTKIASFLLHMQDEYWRSREELKFDDFHSGHEGVGVIREEYLELEKYVFKKTRSVKDIADMQKECIQIAAMAMAFAIELL